MRQPLGVLAVLAAAVLGLAGCGSSSHGSRSSTHGTSTSSTSSAASSVASAGTAGRVVRAADMMGTLPGYRVQAQFAISTGGTSVIHATVAGVIDRAADSGQLQTVETIQGRRVSVTERFHGQTYYISAAGIPQMSSLTRKPWLKLDNTQALSSLGLGGLQTQSADPSQFILYLKAAGGRVQKLGTATIDGVATTHYRAVVDIADYPKLVPAADRAQARRAVSVLESTIGGHTLPMQVWIDSRNLVRRVVLGFMECVDKQHLSLAMTIDLSGYGRQPAVTVPPASQTFDLTPLVKGALSKVKLGCSASA